MRRRASSPKLVLWNNALVSALGGSSFEEALANPGWWGRLVENAVGSHLLNGLSPSAFSVSHWRKDGEEVDFVVERGTTLWAVEVKSGRSQKASGLQRFRQHYPHSRLLIVGSVQMGLRESSGRRAKERGARGDGFQVMGDNYTYGRKCNCRPSRSRMSFLGGQNLLAT